MDSPSSKSGGAKSKVANASSANNASSSAGQNGKHFPGTGRTAIDSFHAMGAVEKLIALL
ncbi:hypothetical protein HDU93_009510, partial [Gonapodya sp. JEL0774]